MDKASLLKKLEKFSRDELYNCIIKMCQHPELDNGACVVCFAQIDQQEFVQGINHIVDIGSEVLGSQGAKGIKAFRILSKEEAKTEAGRYQMNDLFRGLPQAQINSINTAWLQFRRKYEENPRFNVGLKGKKRLSIIAWLASDASIYSLDQIIDKVNRSDRIGKIDEKDVIKYKRDIIDKIL